MHERDILLAALEESRPREREAFLVEVCGADGALRSRIEALLRASEMQDSFLEHPAIETEVLGPETNAIRQKAGEHEELSLDFLHPSDDPEALGRLGPYTITEVIGRGGMGVVLKARDTKLNRIVAIKVMAPELATNPTARKRFQREAHAAAAVVHQHIVTIHAVDEDRLPYLVMECIVGQSLKEKIDHEGHLKLLEILRIGQQVASGLAAAHAHGLIHRDVKPANILLENGIERVRITDFGLARAVDDVGLTRTGEVAGTPQYMSPEQAQGLSMDARSDLFSFGCVLYAMCTGRPPFRAETAFATARRVCEDTPRPIREINPEIPQWLTDIIERLLKKDPAERFQSAREVAELLGQYLAHAQQPAIVPLPGKAPVSPKRKPGVGRRQWSVALLALLLLLALALGLSEASGVTNFVPTVIRIVRGEGTLVIEVADPTVEVSLDGKELSIRGAGLQELRLLPGKHRLHAKKDGEPVKDEIVTITRDSRKVVTITLESPSGTASSSVAPAVEEAVGELKLLAKLEGHSDLVRAVAVLPDGRRMVSVGVDKFVRLWDLPTRTALTSIPLERAYLSSATISADGRLVAVVSRLDGKVVARVWDTEKRAVVCEFSPELSSAINCIRFTRDGTRLATSGMALRNAVLWDAATGMELGQLDTGDAKSVHQSAFSPDGRLLAIGSLGRVRLFDVPSRNLVAEVQLSNDRNVLDLVFAPSGKVLATGQMGGQVTLIDVDSRRVIKSMQGSDAEVHALQFLSSDLYLLASSSDATLRLWNLDQERVVAQAETDNGTNRGLSLLPDGKQVITAGGKEWDKVAGSMKDYGDYALRLWQLPESVWPKEPEPTPEDLKLLAKLDGHSEVVPLVAFVSDGRRIISVGRDQTVSVWDVQSRSKLSSLSVDGYLAHADVSTDGRFVATALRQKKVVQVWDLEKRQRVCDLVHDFQSITCMRLSPDGTRVVTSGNPAHGVLWDVSTGKELRRFDIGETGWAEGGAFSPDGRVLALGAVGRVRLFDIESGDVLGDISLPDDRTVSDLEFGAKGKTLASGQAGGHVSLVDVDTRRVIKRLQGSVADLRCLRFLANDTVLLTSSQDGTLRVWDLEGGNVVATATTEKGTNGVVSVSPEGRHVVTANQGEWDKESRSIKGNGDYALRLWQLPESVWPKEPEPTPEDLKLLAKLDGHSDLVRGVAFLPDGRRFVSVGRDKMVRIWDLATRSILSTLPVEGYLRDADVSADGRLVAMVSNSGDKKGIAQVWDIEKQERLCELVQDVNFSNCIRFSPDGTHVVTIGSPSIGILWDLTTKKEIGRFDVEDPFSVQAIEFSPDGRRLAIGASGRVRLFDIESGDVVGDVLLPQPRAVISLAFSSDGKSLASGQMGGSTCLIDVERRQVTSSLPNSDPHAHVLCVRFLDNGRFLLTTHHETTLRIWDLERMRVVATGDTEKGTNKRLCVSPNGRYAVSGDGEVWDEASKSAKPNGDYALRLWQLPESVWPKASRPTSPPADTANQIPQPEAGAFVVLGSNDIAERKFDTLSEAVSSAKSGDTIEVRNNGPFLSDTIRLEQPLVLRAGRGFRPVIRLTQAASLANEPLIHTTSKLVLEGMVLERIGDDKARVVWPSILDASDSASLFVANCRFVTTFGRCFQVGKTGTLRNCEFLTPGKGYTCTWTATAHGQGVIDNCISSGRIANFDPRVLGMPSAKIRLSRNTTLGNVHLDVRDVVGLMHDEVPLQIDASSNVFGHHVLFLHQKSGRSPAANETAAIVLRFLQWNETQNVYPEDAEFFTWSTAQYKPLSTIDELSKWNDWWKHQDAASVQGVIRFAGGDLKARATINLDQLTAADFRLHPDSAGYRAGPDGKDLGADMDLVGAGEAYERWKQTPEYQEWLKETGQQK